MSAHSTANQLEINATAKAVIHTLLYFDIWDYPLSTEEIHRHLRMNLEDQDGIVMVLEELRQRGLLHSAGPFWALRPMPLQPAKRQQGNLHCETRMATARRYSKLIARFPYVRGVCLSGSISKGYMEEDADIDYFIITEPGRLWIARTLLIAFKKIFLLNSRRNFCVNYFIDTHHLRIPDHNLFTATEAATLCPVVNAELYSEFIRQNEWIRDYFPNFKPRETSHCLPAKRGAFQWVVEKLLPGALADRIDTWCMRRTMKRWRNKFAHFGEEKLKTALASEKTVSKHHPQDYKSLVLAKLEERRAAFEAQFNLSLSGGND